jgi:hypothetical protein
VLDVARNPPPTSTSVKSLWSAIQTFALSGMMNG